MIWAKRGVEIWIDSDPDKDKINVSSPLCQKEYELVKIKAEFKLIVAQKRSDMLMRYSRNSSNLKDPELRGALN